MPKKGYKLTIEHKRKVSKALIGIKRSEITRQKMSEAKKGNKYPCGCKRTETTRKKMGEAKRGDKNPAKRPEVRKRIGRSSSLYVKNNPEKIAEMAKKVSKTMTGRKLTDKHRENMSKGRSKAIAEGKINPFSHGLNGHFYSKKNKKKLWYRSSWELQAYKILEQLSKVIKYESEPFYIPYKFQGIERNYIPDILVTYDDNSQELIEVMREDLLEDEMRIVKLKAAKRYCDKNNINFSVWTEKFLFKLGRE